MSSVIFLAEPMVTFAQVPALYWHNIGFTKFCTNVRDNLMPDLWALWGYEVSASVIFVTSQCIALSTDSCLYSGDLCKQFISDSSTVMGGKCGPSP